MYTPQFICPSSVLPISFTSVPSFQSTRPRYSSLLGQRCARHPTCRLLGRIRNLDILKVILCNCPDSVDIWLRDSISTCPLPSLRNNSAPLLQPTASLLNSHPPVPQRPLTNRSGKRQDSQSRNRILDQIRPPCPDERLSLPQVRSIVCSRRRMRIAMPACHRKVSSAALSQTWRGA